MDTKWDIMEEKNKKKKLKVGNSRRIEQLIIEEEESDEDQYGTPKKQKASGESSENLSEDDEVGELPGAAQTDIKRQNSMTMPLPIG